jgi:hypothetical protein
MATIMGVLAQPLCFCWNVDPMFSTTMDTPPLNFLMYFLSQTNSLPKKDLYIHV